jgi:ABC-type amino acid transport substrate-binding protein
MRSLALPLAAAIALAPAAAADWAEIRQRGTLRVLAVHEDLFFNLKDAQRPGFDRELLQGFAALHRLELEVVQVAGWDAMLPSLEAGKGDLIAGGYAVTDERLKRIAFSSEAFPSRKVAFNRKPAAPIASLDALRAEKVCTVKGTSMAQEVAAAQVPAANVVFVPSGTMPNALRAGQCGAAVLGVEHVIVQRQRDPQIQLGVFLGEPGSLAFGLRKADTALQAELSAYLDNFRRSPSWSRLVVKYLGDEAAEVLRKAREK